MLLDLVPVCIGQSIGNTATMVGPALWSVAQIATIDCMKPISVKQLRFDPYCTEPKQDRIAIG
jgi:hypothetical protein